MVLKFFDAFQGKWLAMAECGVGCDKDLSETADAQHATYLEVSGVAAEGDYGGTGGV